MRAVWQEALAGTLAGLLVVAAAGVGGGGRPAPATQPAAVAASPCDHVWQPVAQDGSPLPWRTRAQGVAESQARRAALAQMVALLRSMPVYPGARPVGPSPYGVVQVDNDGKPLPSGVPLAAATYPMSPALVDVFRVWRVSSDPFAAVTRISNWAQGRGMRSLMSGQGRGPQPDEDTSWQAFTAPGTPGAGQTPQIQVEAAGSGLIRYDALVVVIPPRPAGETVPPGAADAVVTVCNGLPERQVAQTTVRDPGAVQALAATVNDLPRTTGGVVNCAADGGFRVFIAFEYAAGAAVEVMDFPPCAWAGFLGPQQWPGLSDAGLGTAVEAATGWDLRQLQQA